MAHGLQKFGYLGGRGMTATVGMMEHIGVRPAGLWAWLVSLVEVGGGLLMIVGLLGFVAPFAIAANMAVAAVTVHAAKGFWNSNGGYEFNLVIAGAAVASGLLGFGAWSLDAIVGLALPDWLLVGWAVAMVIGVVGALFSRNVETRAAA